jgi:hypothetical protein
MEGYVPVIALSLVTLLLVLLWGSVQLGMVGKSRKKGDHSAFRHREPTHASPAEIDAERARDRESGTVRHVYKPQR